MNLLPNGLSMEGKAAALVGDAFTQLILSHLILNKVLEWDDMSLHGQRFPTAWPNATIVMHVYRTMLETPATPSGAGTEEDGEWEEVEMLTSSGSGSGNGRTKVPLANGNANQGPSGQNDPAGNDAMEVLMKRKSPSVSRTMKPTKLPKIQLKQASVERKVNSLLFTKSFIKLMSSDPITNCI